MRKAVLFTMILLFVFFFNPAPTFAQCATVNPCNWNNICNYVNCNILTDSSCPRTGLFAGKKYVCSQTYVCLPQCSTQGSTTTVTPGTTPRETTNTNTGGSSAPATGWCGQASCPQAWCSDVACIGPNPSTGEAGGCFSASSWNSGGRDRCSNDGCCGGGPPPVYGCNGNSCTEQSSGSGPYENDNSCASRCGAVSLTNSTLLTKSASQRNSLACNGTNGTPDLRRSSSNSTNNPALFNIDASVEETNPGAYQRSWNVKKIDFSGGTIPATTIWNNGAAVANSYTSFASNPGVGFGSSQGGGFTYRTINASIFFDLNMTNNGYTPTAGVSCDNSLVFTDREQIGGSNGNLSSITGSKEIFRYGCNSAKANPNPLAYTTLKSNLITEAVNKLNGGTNNGTNTYRWGVFSKDINNVVTELSGKGLEITITEGYYKYKTLGELETIWVSGDQNTYNNLPAEAIDQKYYFYVNFKLNNTLTPPINTSLVTCTKFMLPLISDQSLIAYQLTCTIDKSFPLAGDTTNASSSDDYGFKEYYKDMLNNNGMVGFTYQGTDFHKIIQSDSTYFAYMDSNQVLNFYTNTISPRETDYHRIISSNFPVQYVGDPASNVARLTFDLVFQDGIPYGNYNLAVTISDGYGPNPRQSVINITHTVDTYLPVVEREVTVDSTTLLKVVSKAEDDHQLKSHALYCAPTSISSAISPYISESRNGQALGTEQIAGYFDADTSVKTCNGVMANNTGDFKVFNTTATTDTRSTYYLLDESKLKNQNEPYEITFGDGKDGSALGRWYAEDSFCNMPASTPTTTVDIGSPWLQTKGGNTYVQGHSDNPLSPDRSSVKAFNYTVNNISFDAGNNICTAPLPNGVLKSYLGTKNQKSNAALTSYINRINQCPEKDDSYVSTYALSSNEETDSTGPRGYSDRFSKINQAATMYSHKLNNVTNYTGGDKNLFDYLSKLIDTSAIIGYSQNNTENTNDDVIIDGNSPLYSGSELAINYINHSVTVDPTVGGDLISQVGSSITVISAPVTVFKINGNLNIRYNTANSGKWNINKSSIILVDGDVTLEPDIIKNGGSLVIAAKGSIVIGNGGYKSAALTKDQVAAGTAYPLYDEIDAFLITDGKLITLPDKGGSSNISIASNPIKPIENIATKPEVRLNNEVIKKAEARTPCIVYYYKDVNRSIPFTQNETVPAGKNLYMSIYLENENDSNFIPAWQYTSVRINGVRANITNPLTINGNSANGYIMIPGSYIVTGNNVIEFGEHTNYTDRTDAVTGYWCEPFTVVGTGSTPTISGNVYCRDTNGNKVGVSNTSIVYTTTSRVPLNPANNATVAPQTVSTIATTDSLGNWSANYSRLKVVWDNRAEPYYYGSLVPTNANYPNGASRLNKASGCFNSNLEEISPKMSGNNMLLDEMNSCGDSNQSYYQSTYTYGGETEDRNNLTLNSLNFDLGSCSSQNQPTQCTAMTINGGNEDVAVTPGSDITVQMTVLNPTETSNMVRINNRDNKCNSTRSNRAALDPLSQFGSYSEMSRGATDPANFQDCEPPATVSVPTTRFTSISSVVNGNSTTYTFKIKAEQLLKKDLNTGLPIKGIEIAGPAEYSDSVNCKVYAHDNRIVYDGLKIYGGIIQTSSFPKGMTLGNSLGIDMDGDGANETDLTCKTSGPITNNQNQYPSSTNPTVITGTASPCFLRDLIMVQNFVAPAEQIEYDPSIQGVFGSILGRKSTILSIRESTDD